MYTLTASTITVTIVSVIVTLSVLGSCLSCETRGSHPLFFFLNLLGAETLQLCPTLYDPMGCSLLDSSCQWDSPGKNTGVGTLPPGDLPDPGIKLSSLMSTCIGRWVLYHEHLLGSPVQGIFPTYCIAGRFFTI